MWTDPQGWRPHLLFLHQNFSQRELPDPQVPPSAQWERGFQITWFGERLHCLLEIDRVQEGSKSTEKLCMKMNPPTHPHDCTGSTRRFPDQGSNLSCCRWIPKPLLHIGNSRKVNFYLFYLVPPNVSAPPWNCFLPTATAIP